MARKKRRSSAKAGTAKRGGTHGKKQTAASEQARRQAKAVLLFAGAVLLMCLAIIPGGSLWGWLHTVVLGLFGLSAYLIPVLMGYLAVVSAMDKPVEWRIKPWHVVTVTVLVSALIQIFRLDVEGLTFAQAVQEAYRDGAVNSGTGVCGAVMGYVLEYLFTDVGSKIIVFLLLFVFLMLITGTSIITFFKALWTPVTKTKETLENAMEQGIQQQREKKRAFDAEKDDGPIGGAKEPDVLPEPAEVVDPRAALERAAAEVAADADALFEAEGAQETAVVVEPEQEVEDEETEEAEEKPEKPNEAEEEKDEYIFPPLSLLNESKSTDTAAAAQEQNSTAELLVQTLNEFGVSAKVLDVSRGPTVTRYELQPSAGVKISRITGLADDIALRLATTGVRIEAPIPNKAAVGIEVPNRVSGSVCLRDLIGSKRFAEAESRMTVALGKDIAGQIVLTDLAKMPHLLIAGTTGSGKSVCTNSMIQSILFHARPDEVRLLLIDPKQVEFGIYNGIPHLLVPVVTDPHKAAGALGWAVTEMLNRYKMFSENNVRDIFSYNELVKDDETRKPLPQILIVIDELADLMMVAANQVESNICRLAQMARAAGMHLVIATQRPSVDVITGLIKANIPSRLALTVASAVDSRTIIDTGGAEKLLGKGDMLFMPVGFSKPMRVQGCFVGNREVESVVDFLKSTTENMQYDEAIQQEINRQAQESEKTGKQSGDDDDDDIGHGDPLLQKAVEVILETGNASTSFLQRKLSVGYSRAGRLVDGLERMGIIGPPNGSKPRQVLITRQQWLEMNMTRPDDGDI